MAFVSEKLPAAQLTQAVVDGDEANVPAKEERYYRTQIETKHTGKAEQAG